MNDQPVVQYASKTDVGMRRSTNQDSLVVRLCSDYEEWQRCGHVFVVADGMGGHSVGDLASRITVEAFPQAFYRVEADSIQDRMRRAMLSANKAVNDRGLQNPEFSDMGTTCSAVSLSQQGAVIGHIGDSRVYRLRGEELEQLTFDHSLQWEMIRLGRATPANVDLFHPRNVITRCIGPDPNVKVDVEGPFSVRTGDRLVLCSDGLSNHVSDTEIGQIAAALSPTDATRLLVNLANCRGGSDNSTVIIVYVENYPPVSGRVVDQDAAVPSETPLAISQIAPAPALNRRLTWLALAACTAFGVALLAARHWWAGGALLLIAGLIGLMQLRGARPRQAQRAGADASQEGFSLQPGLLRGSDDPSEISLTSPYRCSSSVLTDTLLDHLAEIQGELVQAARDSGWSVNFDELTTLSRQSVAAQQHGKLERAIQPRAQAIDLLMRELYSRARSSGRQPT